MKVLPTSFAHGALRQAVIAIACAACAFGPLPALANQPDDQATARIKVGKGGALPLREIESIVLPKMRGMTYVSNRYYPDENVYILRFTDGPKVVDVEVDAKTGKILWRSK
jgi:uncharacterized membrane protein YkoI